MAHSPDLGVAAKSIVLSKPNAATGHKTTKYPYIDAIRGYAVLLVITCHTGTMFAQLPYPLKKLTNFGWYGVQLFFLMSCVTLLLSWRSDEAKGRVDVFDFWVRRFFRIAPMYYLAAIFYYVIETPKSGFNAVQLLATLAFVNAWHPLLIPTVTDRWIVVPGGWSIGVEVTFYAMFPLIALLVRSARSALIFFILAVTVGWIANAVTVQGLQAEYGQVPTSIFLYYWFPNQMPVFALGAVLYCMLDWLRANPGSAVHAVLRRAAMPIVTLCFLSGLVVANAHLPKSLPFTGPLGVPAFLLASIIFMVFIAILATDPATWLINALIRALGRVSFSAYLLHFALLYELPRHLPAIFDIQRTGWHAIFTFWLLWFCAVPGTFCLSWLTFRFVELPMIDLGRRLLIRRPMTVDRASAAQS